MDLRALVITRKSADLPRDVMTNTLYFKVDGPWSWDFELNTPEEHAIANDLRDVFRARVYHTTGMGVEVKLYDMADPIPRRALGKANWQAATGAGVGAPGPREVALCLSFRGALNIPRQRGRIYLPGPPMARLDERPALPMLEEMVPLATAIGNVGGPDVDWCVRSSFGPTMHPVKYAWMDNEWDTVRSRGLRPNARVFRDLNE